MDRRQRAPSLQPGLDGQEEVDRNPEEDYVVDGRLEGLNGLGDAGETSRAAHGGGEERENRQHHDDGDDGSRASGPVGASNVSASFRGVPRNSQQLFADPPQAGLWE